MNQQQIIKRILQSILKQLPDNNSNHYIYTESTSIQLSQVFKQLFPDKFVKFEKDNSTNDRLYDDVIILTLNQLINPNSEQSNEESLLNIMDYVFEKQLSQKSNEHIHANIQQVKIKPISKILGKPQKAENAQKQDTILQKDINQININQKTNSNSVQQQTSLYDQIFTFCLLILQSYPLHDQLLNDQQKYLITEITRLQNNTQQDQIDNQLVQQIFLEIVKLLNDQNYQFKYIVKNLLNLQINDLCINQLEELQDLVQMMNLKLIKGVDANQKLYSKVLQYQQIMNQLEEQIKPLK